MKKTKLSTVKAKKKAKAKPISKIKVLRLADIKDFDFNRCQQTATAKILGLTINGLTKRLKVGAPRNLDSTVSVKDHIEWLVEHEVDKVKEGIENIGVKDQLVATRTEKLQIQIDRMKGATISREKAREIFERQISELKYYLTESYKINLTDLMSRLKVPSRYKETFKKEFAVFIDGAINSFSKSSNGEECNFQ